MTRAHFVLGIFVLLGAAAPACSGSEFSAADDEPSAGEGGESNGNGGSSGDGGSDGGVSGSSNGGSSTGGRGGSSGGTNGGGTSGSSTGGDAGEAGEGATGGASGGMGGSSGMATGGQGGRSGSGGAGGNGGSSGAGGPTGGGPAGGTSGLGGTGGGPVGGGPMGGTGGVVVVGNCPPSPPANNTPCVGADFCSYGSHPLSSCREIYSCIGGAFTKSQDSCPTPPPCQDTTDPPVVVGAACSPDGYQCQLDPTVFCMCAMDCPTACTIETVWHCFGPPSGCPTVLPNHGQPCSGSSSCLYGTCRSQTATNAVCEAGLWRWRGAPCPR